MVRNVTLCDCGLLVQGKVGLIMLVVVPPAHTKLYFTKDIVDDSFVPRNRKPKTIPKPEAKPAPKAAPKGKACAIVQDDAQGGKGLLFHSS